MAALKDELADLPDSDCEEEVVTTHPDEDTSLGNTSVVTKHSESARITNATLDFLLPLIIADETPLSIMTAAEQVLLGLVSTVYNAKKDGKSIEKGIAFPICLSVNERICNYSPLASEEQVPLVAGDMVKIDLGCHIDGYIAVTAHTVIVADAAGVCALPSPEAGDVAVAAHLAMQLAAALIRPGVKNSVVTKAVEACAAEYGVKCMANVRMSQMKQFVLDGKKEVALAKPNPDIKTEEQKVDETEFEENEVYSVDIIMSSGDGEGREGEDRTTVYKRNVETKYKLKKDSSHTLLREVNSKAGTMAFSLRMVEEERIAKAGVIECVAHNLFSAYPVFSERNGAHIAHFKTTLLVMPAGNKMTTGLPLPAYFTSKKSLGEENAKILSDEAEKVAAKKAKADKKKAAKKNKKK